MDKITIYDFLTLASLILSIVSIWLSLYFYRQSNKLSDVIVNNLNDLKILTNKIEGFYNRIYEDTFSIMRKNYEISENNKSNIIEEQVKTKMLSEIQLMLKDEFSNNSTLKNNDFSLIAEKISNKSNVIEERIKEETYQSEILNLYNKIYEVDQTVLFDTLVNEATQKGIDYRDLIKELAKMKEKNILFYKEPINALTTILKSK